MKSLKIALAAAVLSISGAAQAMPPESNDYYWTVIHPFVWSMFEEYRFCNWSLGGVCTG